jgi:hypothetical protein
VEDGFRLAGRKGDFKFQHGAGGDERVSCTLLALVGDATVARVWRGAVAGGGWGDGMWMGGLGWAPWLLSGRLVGSWRLGRVGAWTAGKRPKEREGEAKTSERGS